MGQLTEKQVLSIREAYASGLSAIKIAPRFGVSHQAVSMIVQGTRWASLTGGEPLGRDYRTPPGELCPTAKMNWKSVRKIRADYAKGGISMRALGEKHGIATSTVHKIVSHQTWKE